MTAVWIVLGISGWVLVVAGILVSGAYRRSMLQHALRLRATLRPYLQRRASEAGLDMPQTQSAGVEPIVDELCELASALTEHERGDPAEADTINQIAVSDTQPLADLRKDPT